MKDTLINRWNKFFDNQKKKYEPLSADNWFLKAAIACERASDAVLREEKGASTRVAKGVAGKLGAVGTSVGIFSIASILGTASTGTAIGSLSGAAFTSAALAWVGGSVFMGSIILGIATIAGGVGAVVGAGWASKKYLFGKRRNKTELEEQEQKLIDACLSLAAAFRQQAESGNPIEPSIAKALYGDALKPISEDLLYIQEKTNSWPFMARKRLNSAIDQLSSVSNWLMQWAKKNPNASVGVVSVVFLQLFSNDIPDFDANEQLVIDALRRSDSELHNASIEEISTYVQSKEPSQLLGLQNNVKGIYHELRYADAENNDGDEYVVELFAATNHPGSDVIITNTITGEVREAQLKATDYLSYIKEHNQKYEDIAVFATDEVASTSEYITSTGVTNRELGENVHEVFEGLDGCGESGVASSMTIAAMISLARNVNVLLRGGSMTTQDKTKVIQDGVVAAGVAGIFSLLIG